MASKVFVNLVGQFSPNELSSKQNRRGRTANCELPTYAVRRISDFESSVRKEQNHSLFGGCKLIFLTAFALHPPRGLIRHLLPPVVIVPPV